MNALFMEYDKEDYKNTAYNDAKREVAINMINRNYPIHDVIDQVYLLKQSTN